MTVDVVSVMQKWDFWQVLIVLKALCSEMASVPEMDIVTLALNMYSQGVDPQLDSSVICRQFLVAYEEYTGMHIDMRSP